MNLAKILKRTAVAATLSAAVVSYAQDIKLGFNGDLSASPSAQSGKAGVIGIEAAIADINAKGLQEIYKTCVLAKKEYMENLENVVLNRRRRSQGQLCPSEVCIRDLQG